MGAGHSSRARFRLVGALVVVALLATAVLVRQTSAQAAAAPKAARATVRVTHATTASRKTKSTSAPFPATGYFTTGQLDGRWFLVTPQGEPFYSDAVDTVSPVGDTDKSNGQCPYCQTVAADYGTNTAAWATATAAQLRSWGFNSLGPYSDYKDLGSQMPFTVQLSMASGDDWFAPSFVTNADAAAAEYVAPLANNPNVIGYYTDSELNWGPPRTMAPPSPCSRNTRTSRRHPRVMPWLRSTPVIPTGSSLRSPSGTSRSPRRLSVCTIPTTSSWA